MYIYILIIYKLYKHTFSASISGFPFSGHIHHPLLVGHHVDWTVRSSGFRDLTVWTGDFMGNQQDDRWMSENKVYNEYIMVYRYILNLFVNINWGKNMERWSSTINFVVFRILRNTPKWYVARLRQHFDLPCCFKTSHDTRMDVTQTLKPSGRWHDYYGSENSTT